MFPTAELSASTKIVLIKAASGSGTSLIESDAIDMAGYDGVLILTTVGTANAGNFIKAYQSAAADLSGAADLAGSKVTPANNATTAFLDILKPAKRYLGVSVTRGSATAVGEVYAILYRNRTGPVSNAGNTLKGVYLKEPAEGTA